MTRFYKGIAVAAISVLAGLGWASASLALDAEQRELLLSQPPRLQWLEPGAELPDGIVTPYTISETGLTIPSLWWMQSQYGEDLLNGWIAVPAINDLPPRVDLVVNESVWRNYSYWERYAFVTLFGRTSDEFGYITRIFNEQRPQPRALAVYLCGSLDVQDRDPSYRDSESEDCQVFMDTAGTGVTLGLEERLREF